MLGDVVNGLEKDSVKDGIKQHSTLDWLMWTCSQQTSWRKHRAFWHRDKRYHDSKIRYSEMTLSYLNFISTLSQNLQCSIGLRHCHCRYTRLTYTHTEGVTDRQTDRQTHKQRHTHCHCRHSRLTYTHTDGVTHRQTDRHTNRDRHTLSLQALQANIHTYRRCDRQTDRHTDTQTDKQTETHTHTIAAETPG